MSGQGKYACTWTGGKKALMLEVDSKGLLRLCWQWMESGCRWISQYRAVSHWRLCGVLLLPSLPCLRCADYLVSKLAGVYTSDWECRWQL